jgi:hypothetical protein
MTLCGRAYARRGPRRLLAALLLLGLPLLALATPALFSEAAVLGDEAGGGAYNVELRLRPPAGRTSVSLAVEWETPAHALLVTLSRTRLAVARLHDGRTLPVRAVAVALPAKSPVHLALLRRGEWVGLLCNERLVLEATLPPGPGTQASLLLGEGWGREEARVQPVEPVYFADDFMRTESLGWTTPRGHWRLQSAWASDPKAQTLELRSPATAQNPFALVGSAPEGPALATATAGRAFWDDYTVTAAVRLPADGAVGLVVNMPTPGEGLLLRWSPVAERGPQGDRLAAYHLTGGRQTLLAAVRGGFLPGQWASLAVTSSLRDGVRVVIDGQERLLLPTPPLRRGGIGLYTESALGTLFDDITVYGRTLNVDLLAESRQRQIGERFRRDAEMKAWARSQSDWLPRSGGPGAWVHRFDFWGESWITATVVPAAASGRLVLTLEGDPTEALAGLHATITLAGDGAGTYRLARGGIMLTETGGAALPPRESTTFRLLHRGTALRLQRDGATVLEATVPAPGAGRPAYRAEGGLADVRETLALGPCLRDYPFATAPVEWLGEGTWAPTIRWSCAPEWSFLGGWSRGDAVLWHKRRVAGDQTLQAFLGIKMEYPGARAVYEERFRGLGVALCTDGRDPRSGYAVLFGAPDGRGGFRKTVLYRNGVEVASTPQGLPPKTYGHHTWFDLTLTQRAGSLRFEARYTWKNMWVPTDPGREMTVTLAYTDPAPLAGGVPAIWTADNGITLARARLWSATPPTPRTEPQVSIVEPTYPEWGEVGKALVLDFPPLWASDGRLAEVRGEPGEVPPGEDAPAVAGSRVTLTPRVPGEHWYRLRAHAGPAVSPAVHVALPVFAPSLGRDDGEALVLYRFDEGTGAVVHDRAPHGPPADLTIPADSARWLAGGGLAFSGPSPLHAAAVPKLMRLAERAGWTLELWTSAATNDSPTGSSGCLLSWGGTGGGRRNFTLAHYWYTLQFTGPNAYYNYHSNTWQGPSWSTPPFQYPFHPFLQHVVLVCEAPGARLYLDGRPYSGAGTLTELTRGWRADAPLLLGNLADRSQRFLGTYYLVALHGRALSAADVQRHYEAGPGAR